MLFEEPSTKEHLSRIVQRVGRNPSWHDDLMQEAMIHLWCLESREPGHTLSWYLQSCLFHLKNHLSAGRSVDSVKRQHQSDSLSTDAEGGLFEVVGEDSIHSEVIGREIVVMLKESLTPLDQAILTHLAEGFGYREIARKLGISHPAVIKHRRGIAAVAVQLGIGPLSNNGNSFRLNSRRPTPMD